VHPNSTLLKFGPFKIRSNTECDENKNFAVGTMFRKLVKRLPGDIIAAY